MIKLKYNMYKYRTPLSYAPEIIIFDFPEIFCTKSYVLKLFRVKEVKEVKLNFGKVFKTVGQC